MFKPSFLVSLICLFVAGCASTPPAGGNGTFELLGIDPAGMMMTEAPREYRLGVSDKIGINVNLMPALTFDALEIDDRGNINLPQVGQVPVAGKTTEEVREDLVARLRECCLVNPFVNVSLKEARSQLITVAGAVRTPNVYALRGKTTLFQAIAQAGGPDQAIANTRLVAVFRTQDGRRMGAKFDLDAIMDGRAPDPEVLAGDYIIVDTSDRKSTLRNTLQAIPLFGVFTGIL